MVLSPTLGSPDDRKCENAERNRNEAGNGLPIEDPYLCGRKSWVDMISEIAWNSAKSLIQILQDEIISRVDIVSINCPKKNVCLLGLQDAGNEIDHPSTHEAGEYQCLIISQSVACLAILEKR